eukprot:TRINITY_DN10693_c0_g1_i1.p1 TRINITY_DN10693_c0_g1~~TRINITY_DN10693_c0_g1_i1.p1  ORF type:complete len:470 (+),score=95.07 TRINITY_DN10693_c0_g1_i1:68-1477(+)
MNKALTLVIICIFVVGVLGNNRVAIIGGGMGGSSAAYHLSKYLGDDVEIVLYERSGRLGGRVQSVTMQDITTELGGSVYHKLNYLMIELVKEFGLTAVSLGDESTGKFGIWNGEEFVFLESDWNIVTAIKALWRWGLTTLNIDGDSSSASFRWAAQYSETEPWHTIEEFLEKYNLKQFTNITLEEYFQSQGYDMLYPNEMIAGMTRVTYNLNITEISALGGLISIVGSGSDLYHVKEGNYRVAEEAAKRSGADIRFKTRVTKVSLDFEIEDENNIKKSKYIVETEHGEKEIYDAVILATPLETFKPVEIAMPLPPAANIKREYRKVYTTLVFGELNPSYFGLENVDDIPHTIMTSSDSSSPFNSIGIKEITPDGVAFVKFFSTIEFTDDILDQIFVKRFETNKHIWWAYPKLVPNLPLQPIKLDNSHFYYVNGFESALSVIEGSLVSGRNIARLLAKDWKDCNFEEFHH